MSLKNVLDSARDPADGKPPTSRPWSLAARLTAWYAGSAFALVLLATGFLYWFLVVNFDREDSETLADEIHILRALLRDWPDDSIEIKQEVQEEWAARRYVRIYIRILD